MKKAFFILSAGVTLSLASCTGKNNSNSTAQDTSANVNTGLADSSMSAGSGAPVGTPASGNTNVGTSNQGSNGSTSGNKH